MTTGAPWAEVRAAFTTASELAPADQEPFLRRLAAESPAVAQAVKELLAADSDGFLSLPPSGAAGRAPAGLGLEPGTLVSGYRIERLLGRGGSGEVHAAVRVAPDLGHRVAIKFLSRGTGSLHMVARFERERRILARLNHPHIAALFDGGVLTDGSPYLVMEYVEGERITDWCRAHAPTVEQRLHLFEQVCAAVGHAHRNFIVHRDLKPGNIMVTRDGSVKLLDFGIAKVLAESVELHPGASDPATRPDTRSLTPEYAAPEQLTDGPITTGTDVYALGLLLYELLTGTRPFASRHPAYHELVRAVTSDLASPPSLEVRSDAGLETGAPARLRGDLDAITLRALRADPAERYATVDELLADLHRYHAGLPVLAMRGHRLYRAGKFIRRNWRPVSVSALLLVSVAAGIVTTRRQNSRANLERDRARATTTFLTDMLQAVDPSAQGRDVLMREVLDRAAARIVAEPPPEPEVEASLQGAIGASYLALGRLAQAEPHLTRALQLRRAHPEEKVALSDALNAVASLHDERGEFEVADSFYRQALAQLGRATDTAAARRAAVIVNQMARMQSQLGNYPAAVTLLREALDRESAIHGAASLQAARITSDLGVTLLQAGEVASADSAERRALAMVRGAATPHRPLEGVILGRFATTRALSGDRAGADSSYRAAIAMLTEALGPEHPDVTWFTYNYAGSLLDWGEPGRAIAMTDLVLKLRGRSLPDTHPMVASSLVIRGEALDSLGQSVAAAVAYREALALRRRALPSGHWLIGSVESSLGATLWRISPSREASILLTDGCRIVRAALGPSNPKSRLAEARLRATGQPDRCE